MVLAVVPEGLVIISDVARSDYGRPERGTCDLREYKVTFIEPHHDSSSSKTADNQCLSEISQRGSEAERKWRFSCERRTGDANEGS